MSQLYLIRHGIAADRDRFDQDFDRPLTEPGIKKTTAIAQRLATLDLYFDRLLTSPLVRAQQTAELLHAAGLCQTIETLKVLAPGGAVEDLLTWWANVANIQAQESIAIVGHEPDLGRWAQWLVWGAARDQLVVKKAGIIGLNVPSTGLACGVCELFWLTPPRFLL